MKKGLTELVFILDRSGSMGGLEKDTIGGFNAMLEKQKAVAGECVLTTALFDQRYSLLHDRLDIHGIKPLTEREYSVGGSTALLDAIGLTIDKIAAVQKNTAEEYRAEKVLFVIITDGEENASRRYTASRVKEMIGLEKEKYGWEFLFLGANIDAVETAARFGVGADRAQSYHADKAGVALNYEVMSKTVASFRTCSELPEDWNRDIDKDYKNRGGK